VLYRHQHGGPPAIVYFGTDWCRYCKFVERTILPDPEIRAAMAPFLKVRVNPDDGGDEDDIAKLLHVSGYPTLYVVRNNQLKRFELYDTSNGKIRPLPTAEILAQLR